MNVTFYEYNKNIELISCFTVIYQGLCLFRFEMKIDLRTVNKSQTHFFI